ncbi:MAG TPA: alpha/beta fold hydrolase [Steroidobacteraceae bacterium]
MRKLLRILGWTFGFLALLVGGCVAHANYRISHDEVQAIDTQAPGQFFTVQGHRLHVRVLGDLANLHGELPLLLIHGFALPGHETFLPWAHAELEPHRVLILPDMLGYGFSERNPVPGNYFTLQSYSRDLAGILDALGVAEVDVAGHSWGGMIAAQFALDHPDRVHRLALIDAGFFMPSSSPLEKIIHLPLGIGRAVAWHALGDGPFSYVKLMCQQRRDCELIPPTHIKGSSDTLQAMIYTSRHSDQIAALEASLGRIHTATLVLWGAQDQIVPLATAEKLTRAMPAARSVVIEDAWHMPWLEEPAATAQPLLEFFAAPEKEAARPSQAAAGPG